MNYSITTCSLGVLMFAAASCSRVKPYNLTEHATLECIRSASWEITSSREQSLMEELKLIEVINSGSEPILFRLIPWWKTEGLMTVGLAYVDPTDIPDTYLLPGSNVTLRIVHPVFYREGGMLFTSRKLKTSEIATYPDAEAYQRMGMIPFGYGRSRRITRDELEGQGILIIKVKDKERTSQQ